MIGFLRRDYGAAGLYSPMQRAGTLARRRIQIVVAMTVITLFIPCIANFFMIVKERGLKTGAGDGGLHLPVRRRRGRRRAAPQAVGDGVSW